MVIVAGNRILGGVGAPDPAISDAFGLGANTAINQRVARQGLAERQQQMAWDAEDRARRAKAFADFGADPGMGSKSPGVGGMFAAPPPGASGSSVAPPGFRLGAPGQIDMPRPEGAPNLTFGLLREFEGFRDTPYWDVTAYRTGYGSDTVTMSDGRVVQVQPGMKIDRADAERDLMRRVNTEFAPRAASQVGPEIWGQLPEYVTAPLISVAYNYGSLPDSVVAAVRTGDPETIAAAVEALGSHNDGINARRRAQEAAIIRSGGAIDPALMQAAAMPMGTEGMNSVPAAAPVAPVATPVAGLRLAPDGSIVLPTAAEAMAARPGAFAAGATADRLAQPAPDPTDYNPDLQYQILRAEAAVVDAEQMFKDMPSGATAQQVTAAKARLLELQRQLPASQAALAPLQAPVIADRGLTALEGPESVTLTPRSAGLTVPTDPMSQPAPADAVTPPVTTQDPALQETAPVEQTPAPAPAPAPAQPRDTGAAWSAFDPLAGQVPLAGVTAPGMTTMDVNRGATVSTISDDFPGIGALFNDSAALAVEWQTLEASAAALRRQRELARQLQDANLMLDADSKLAVINARRGVIQYIAAGNAATTGNMDPMAEALTEMSGQQVQIRPRGDNTYDLIVDGQVARTGLPANVMVEQFMYGVNDQYRALVDQARAAEAQRNAAWFDAQIEMLKETVKQEAQGSREMALEYAKRTLDLTLGAMPEFYTEKMTVDGEEVIVVYDRKNPGTPMRVIGMQENPLVPGEFNLVDRPLRSTR